MDESNGKSLPSELEDLERRLRRGRAQASAVELDELKLRAMHQARQAKPTTRPGGQLLKSRLALLTMIVLGLLMSTTGIGLAISGSSGSGSASSAQYGETTTTTTPPQGGTGNNQTVAGAEQNQNAPAKNAPSSGTAPKSANSPNQGNVAAKQQAVSSGRGGGLPFTGFLAIPLLLGGVALLGTGSVLRWRNQDQS